MMSEFALFNIAELVFVISSPDRLTKKGTASSLEGRGRISETSLKYGAHTSQLTLSLPESIMETGTVVLTFESVGRILWCDHSNETSLIVRSHGTRALFNRVSKVIPQSLWFCIATLCDWLKTLAPLPRPIRSKTKTNRDLLARVFPRLARATCICFEL